MRAGGNQTGGDRPYGTDVDTLDSLVAHTLNAKGGAGRSDSESETFLAEHVSHALRAGGFDASEDGTGRGTPLVPMSFAIQAAAVRENPNSGPDGLGVQADLAYTLEARAEVQGVALRGRENGATAELTGDVMMALRTGGGGGDKPHILLPFDETQITSAENRCNPQPGDPCHPLVKGGRPPTLALHARQDPDHGPVTHPLDTDGSSIGIFQSWRVRRLMPVECERLQGFPDGYTAINYRGKPAADGPRYKALGNSMAVNVMRWIGRRIEMVDAIDGSAA